MAHWSGLGYYARARNLHACAQAVIAEHGGEFPREPEAIAALPGIGRSTANAIAVFCFGARVPILDGNVKRLLSRHAGIEGFPGSAGRGKSVVAATPHRCCPKSDVDTYIQAQMDLGATICTRSKPKCELCPVAEDCVARRDGRTGGLPTAKPRKALPQREATMLVLIETAASCCCRDRPRASGAACCRCPNSPSAATPNRKRLASVAASCRSGHWHLSHTFTHFRLTIQPLLCEVQSADRAAEPGARWLTAPNWRRRRCPRRSASCSQRFSTPRGVPPRLTILRALRLRKPFTMRHHAKRI